MESFISIFSILNIESLKKTVLSVDVAKNKSMIMLINSDEEILIDTKEIKHNLEQFKKVKEEIKEINPEI